MRIRTSTRLRLKIVVAALISLCLLAGLPALAQTRETTPILDHSSGESAAASAESPITSQTGPPAHKFFDARNSLAIASVAASLAGDAWSTQRALAYPGVHEVNPVARPFVGSRAGEIAYSCAGFALVTGGMYLAHETSHHRWERIAPFVLAGWEGFLTAWNLHQISRAQATR